MEWIEFTAKTVEEALDKALQEFETTSDKVEYEVLERESNGLLGFFSKPAKIRVKKIGTLKDVAENFLNKVCKNMDIEAKFEITCDDEEGRMDINILGNDMGLIIGKRGQTLDALQYLTSLVVNKESESYYKVKLDTENYRSRRRETLENLAKSISVKVKKTRKAVTLEAMNPYERRIIHSALQNDKAVETYSEGEEPNRKVVVAPKKGYRDYNKSGGYKKYNNKNYNSNRGGYSYNSYEKKEQVATMEE
ncbi:MAG: protein jag [Lachnospiraceae bacterium]|nr:protein jag [Lachnospiraceae bacterium]